MLNERKLTPDELKKREQIIQNMLNNKQEIVKRYGKEAEKMIYGRATKMVQKQSEKQMENTKLKEMIKAALMGPVSEFQDIEVGADRYEAEKDLGQASAMMSELESLLKGFDWYYYMSDDPRVYRTWGAVDTKIGNLVRKLQDMGYGEDAKNLYNQYAPDGDISMKMKEAKGKDMDNDKDIDSDDYLAARDAAIKKAKGELKEYKAPEDLVRFLQKQGVKIDLKEPYTYKDIKDALKALGLEGKFDDLMPQNFTITMPEVPKGMFEDNHIKKAKGEVDESGWRAMTDDEIMKKQYQDSQLKRLADLRKREEAKARLLGLQQKLHQDRLKSVMGEDSDSVKEGYYGTTNIESYIQTLGYDSFEDFFNDNPGAENALMDWIESVPEFDKMLGDAGLNEDLDLGHQDNEPHMVKAELYRIGKYAMELYAMVEEFEKTGGEVDFPAWWQAKITTSANNMVSAKHYLDFEIKEPQIDAVVDTLTGEEPETVEPEMPQDEFELDEKLTSKSSMKKYIDDFAKSDAPQFKGKSEGKKRQMAIAAKLAKTLKEENKKKSLEEYINDGVVDEGILDRLRSNLAGIKSTVSTSASNFAAYLKGDQSAIKDVALAKNMSILQQKAKTFDAKIADVATDLSKLFPKEVLKNTPEEFQKVLADYASMLSKTASLNKQITTGDIKTSTPQGDTKASTPPPTSSSSSSSSSSSKPRDEKGRFTSTKKTTTTTPKTEPISDTYEVTDEVYNYKGKDYAVQVDKKTKEKFFKHEDGRIMDIANLEKFSQAKKKSTVAEKLAKQLRAS